MASTAGADAKSSQTSNHEDKMNHELDVTESTNHDLPARTMAEDERPGQTRDAQRDDPATVAASEELKHTTISDKIATVSRVQPLDVQQTTGEDKEMGDSGRASTPDTDPTDAQDEEMKERLASPKKKRGRDQEDDSKDLEDDAADEPGSSADGSVVNGSRTTRLEPEKKRPRDTSEDTTKATETTAEAKLQTAPADSAETETTKSEDKATNSSHKDSKTSETSSKPQTSPSGFASSGFASLAASSTSPFGSLGASKPSVFGGNTQAPSGFAALAASKPAESSTASVPSGFGALGAKPTTGFGFGTGATSGFGGLASGSVFGSKLGNGFAGGAGPKLSSFAAPVKETEVSGSKPIKAFGAPESDEEPDSDEDGDSEGGDGNEDEESGKVEADDKKKIRLTKVHIDDGEAGEATLLQMRAKVFAMDKVWKERGVGVLKINAPKSCVSFDENGAPIPGSFDASGLDDEDADPNAPKVPRLIMRQENTHRVVLNTIIVRAMAFSDKQPASSSAQILFTAFEGEKEPKPINILLKMSEANATLFRREIASIQRELES
ncbi:uncharacterized protein LY89DRAFT_684829 [Mollisia scopiformis]|uniref:RanBD1 domain-containing protein n=1 Tax=Mollisia scopiformis TaxID=149040 RepID=A0A194X9D8_MOLSC|nr:uncharacterized protein LY89DRAFT_684829 [Mollisia scopiformis]KUJ16783.1 hypothetical protein LY89DRAFT_684829 [Mollisia scopiformis]